MTAAVTPAPTDLVVDLTELEESDQQPLHAVDAQEADRRSSDAVDRLSCEMNGACTTAVSPHQVAALLEAEGLNDRIVHERFGRSSVFSLASELYDRVPLRRAGERTAESSLEQIGPQPSTVALILRGPVYLAPMVFIIAAGSVLSLERLLWAGMLALLLAWSWNQGYGALVHRLIGRRDPVAAQRMARMSFVRGTLVITLIVAAIATVALGDGSTALFAAGQTAYLIAAATILTFGKDRVLILALLPGLTVAAISLAVPAVPDQVVLAASFLTLCFVIVGMAWVTRDATWAPNPPLSQTDRSIAGFQALLGAVWATLIGLAGFSIAGTPNVLATVSVAAAPMVLTMGVAEWQLLRLRRTARILLNETSDPREFGSRVRYAFARSAAVFTATLVAATLAVGLGAYLLGALTGRGAMLAFGFVWLGIAFFAGLSLASLDRTVIPVALSIYAEALMVFLLVVVSAAAPGRPIASAGVYAASCFCLAVALVVAVFVITPRIVAHR